MYIYKLTRLAGIQVNVIRYLGLEGGAKQIIDCILLFIQSTVSPFLSAVAMEVLAATVSIIVSVAGTLVAHGALNTYQY